MKPLIGIIFLIAASSCLTIEEYVVDYDYSYNANFGKYRTFDFMSQEVNPEDQIYDSYIKEAIKKRLEVLGYTYNKNKPSIIISYKLYYNDIYLRAYVQPELELLVKNEKILKNESDSIIFISGPDFIDEEDEEDDSFASRSRTYNPVQCDLREGSLYITMFDRRKRKSIWQGYASGIFGNEKFNNERYINRTVRKVLDQYRVLSRDYIYDPYN